jgi:TRAP-type C4-dicarboxylate transport system substrate-binding protein
MTNSLVTVVAGLAKSKLSEGDFETLAAVTTEAAARASSEINQAEQNLAAWFEKQGLIVNKVDKAPFISALKPQLESDDQPFTKDQLARLLAL